MSDLRVVASWSGGIDSTAVLACLLARGYSVTAVTLEFGGEAFRERERAARRALRPRLLEVAEAGGGRLVECTASGQFLWEFSPDGAEMPRRNKHIIDYLIMRHCVRAKITNIAMGEYVGADTWVVRDHVPMIDCDHRALSAYIYMEYGLGYRLISLQDFGESRYKVDRLMIGARVLGLQTMAKTTNCLEDRTLNCGQCYKCVERAAAFESVAPGMDPTPYAWDPRTTPAYAAYMDQMRRSVAGGNRV